MPFFNNVVEKLSSSTDLLHNVIALFIFKELKHFNYIRVVNFFQNIYFIEESFQFFFAHACFLDHFYRSLGCWFAMDTHACFSKGTLSQDFTDAIDISKLACVFSDGILSPHLNFLFTHSIICIYF